MYSNKETKGIELKYHKAKYVKILKEKINGKYKGEERIKKLRLGEKYINELFTQVTTKEDLEYVWYDSIEDVVDKL